MEIKAEIGETHSQAFGEELVSKKRKVPTLQMQLTAQGDKAQERLVSKSTHALAKRVKLSFLKGLFTTMQRF